jgi:hypothetical protein
MKKADRALPGGEEALPAFFTVDTLSVMALKGGKGAKAQLSKGCRFCRKKF